MTLPFHPFADLFPMMVANEATDLRASLKVSGLRDSIVLLDGMVLDGRNREVNCEIEDVERRYRLFGSIPSDGSDALQFVLDKNLARRHLTESQRGMVAANLATMRQGERTDIKPSANLQKVAQADAARRLNVSPRTVSDAVKVKTQAEPEIARAVEHGKLAVSAAAQAATLPVEQQRKVAEEAEAGHANVVRTVIKRESRVIRERELGERQRALPDAKFGVIVADPEWKHKAWSEETGEDRAANQHYATNETDVIAARPVGDIADKDCALFLWGTASMLPDALCVMGAWGFTYKTHFIWAKDRVGNARGMGRWLSDEHELLLLGTRGTVPAPTGDLQHRSVFHAPVGEHSAKPECFLEMIEQYFPTLPKIELNRRGPARPGWSAWGNETLPGEGTE